MEQLQIRTLGEFSFSAGGNKISDSDNRTKKVWLILGYLICHRGRVISQKKLIELLWGEESNSSNPENALRITFHRARTMLDKLWPNAGRELILYKEGGYIWNDQIPFSLDCDRFDRLCQLKTENTEARLRACMEALALYQGDFLEKLSSETWVIPVSTHFHNLYVSAVLEAAELLAGENRHAEAVQICRNAISSEPYHEQLHQTLMREMAAAGDRKGAIGVYEALSKRLFDDFGIHPNEQTRGVYREIAHAPGEKILLMDEVLAHLQEPEMIPGAMQCDYDYFKVLCRLESRAMERSGNATHIVLLSISGSPDKPLSKRTSDKVMERLGEQIRLNLRRGDTFSRCSTTQYIMMLPLANYENSCMVARRVIGSFTRKYPHVTARMHFMVQPLTPQICVP